MYAFESSPSPSSYYVETFVPVTTRCGEDEMFVFSPPCHTFVQTSISNCYEYSCRTYSGNWFAHTLGIDPPPIASYYRFDLKMSWGDLFTCDGDPTTPFTGIAILFGDDQRYDFLPDDSHTPCVFEKITTFSTAGIIGSTVRVNLQRLEGNDQYLGVAKTRIWSCECEGETAP